MGIILTVCTYGRFKIWNLWHPDLLLLLTKASNYILSFQIEFLRLIEMIIKEYRITLPMTVEEYQVTQLTGRKLVPSYLLGRYLLLSTLVKLLQSKGSLLFYSMPFPLPFALINKLIEPTLFAMWDFFTYINFKIYISDCSFSNSHQLTTSHG